MCVLWMIQVVVQPYSTALSQARLWVVTFHPRPPELGAGGPWLSSSYPDMPTDGQDMERIARAIRDWWEALYPPHEGGA